MLIEPSGKRIISAAVPHSSHPLRKMWIVGVRNVNVCFQFRSTKLAKAPARTILGDEYNADKPSWQDFIIDVCGPHTKAESGEQYILAYICTTLKVPMLEAFISLQAGHFSRGLVKCILRSRVIPDVVRSDRWPEMFYQSKRKVSCYKMCDTCSVRQ